MHNWIFFFLALFGGMMIAGQGAINGRLVGLIGGPVQAAIVSFSIGLMLLCFISIFSGGMPKISGAYGQPWWVWIGGALGAILVTMAAAGVPKIGATAWISAVIAGQLMAAVVYDHIGAYGLTQKPVNFERLLGIAFLIIGAILVRR